MKYIVTIFWLLLPSSIPFVIAIILAILNHRKNKLNPEANRKPEKKFPVFLFSFFVALLLLIALVYLFGNNCSAENCLGAFLVAFGGFGIIVIVFLIWAIAESTKGLLTRKSGQKNLK